MTASRSDRSEAGTTLIELIITVAIMGFAMLALMGGIGTSIIFATVQRQDATAGMVLTSAAESIVADADPNRYRACATTADYTIPPSSSPGYPVTVSSVAFWEPTSNRFVARTGVPSCDPASPGYPADSGLQRIELSVTSSTGSRAPQVEVLQVVKRQVEP